MQFIVVGRDEIERGVVVREPYAVICRTLGGDDSRFFEEYVPNRYVYTLLLETAPPDLREGLKE